MDAFFTIAPAVPVTNEPIEASLVNAEDTGDQSSHSWQCTIAWYVPIDTFQSVFHVATSIDKRICRNSNGASLVTCTRTQPTRLCTNFATLELERIILEGGYR